MKAAEHVAPGASALHEAVTVVAEATDPPGTARLKGDLAMVDVLRRAVDDRQELPGAPVAIGMDDVTVEIDTTLAAEAAEQMTGRFNPRPFDADAAKEIYRCAQ